MPAASFFSASSFCWARGFPLRGVETGPVAGRRALRPMRPLAVLSAWPVDRVQLHRACSGFSYALRYVTQRRFSRAKHVRQPTVPCIGVCFASPLCGSSNRSVLAERGSIMLLLASFSFVFPHSLRFVVAVEGLIVSALGSVILAACKSGLFFAASTRDCCADVAGVARLRCGCSWAVAFGCCAPGPLSWRGCPVC